LGDILDIPRYELHCHSKYSKCSNLEPELILKIAKKRGLNGIAVMDHNTLAGSLAIKKLNKDKDFKIIIGHEVSTNLGHVLAYNIKKDIKPGDFYQIIKEIHNQGGLAVVAHPFRIWPHLRFKANLRDVSKEIDGIEGLNGRVMFGFSNRKAERTAKELGKAIIAGSDAHFSYEIGDCISMFDGDIENAIRKKSIMIEAKRFYGIKAFAGSVQSVFKQIFF